VPEPAVIASDVRRVLRQAIHPDDPDYGESVSRLAEKASTSTRTVYRVLGAQSETLSLDLADRLCLAAGRHLTEINARVKLPDGKVVEYADA
jgi:hypothetical protein